MVGTRQSLYESTLVDSVVESTWKFARCSHSAVNLKTQTLGPGADRRERAMPLLARIGFRKIRLRLTASSLYPIGPVQTSGRERTNGGHHEIGFESDCQFGCSPKIQKHMFGFVYGCMRSK